MASVVFGRTPPEGSGSTPNSTQVAPLRSSGAIPVPSDTDHHVVDGGLALVPVKTLRFASTTPNGVASVLTGSSTEPGSRLLRDGPGAYGPQCSAEPLHVTAHMDDIIDVEADSERPSLADCRELLGDEAAELSDDQLDAIRQHAQAMAHVLVEIFLSADSRS